MKKQKFFGQLVIVFLMTLLPVFGIAQSCDPLTAKQLKDMLTQMGYPVKDLNAEAGKEKYEVDLTTPNLNVPVALEISASGNFVWLTVFLGKPKDETSSVNAALLKQNFKIQPCQFYITDKGNLMMGLAVENRGLTTVIMRRHMEKLAADVSSTNSLWQ